jgi:hypothetical protein
LVGSWRVGKISGKRIIPDEDPVSVVHISVVPVLSILPVFVVPVLIAPPIGLLSCEPVELILPESVTPVFVVPLPCHPEVSEAQGPVIVVPVSIVSPVELLSCDPVELVPVLVVPVLFSTGVITLQSSSIAVRYITTLSRCVPEYDSLSMITPVLLVSVIVSIPLLFSMILVSEYGKALSLCEAIIVGVGII